MTAIAIDHRLPWANRFDRPDADRLLGELEPPARAHAQELLDLIEASGLRIEIRYMGVPWRWTLVATPRGASANASRTSGSPSAGDIAYVIPSPVEPALALPLDAALSDELTARGAPRVVREAVLSSPPVCGVRWPAWPLGGSPSEANAITDALRTTIASHATAG